MTEKKSVSTGWQSVSRQLNDWSKSALIALVKDLYEVSPDNRDFLGARFQAEQAGGAAIEKYRRRIVQQFFPARGEPELKLVEARKAIRDYRKATGNLEGAIDLMLTYVECGTKFTLQYGDIDASFYSSLASMLNEMTQLLMSEGREYHPKFEARLRLLTTHADRIGWGYGDALFEQVGELDAEFGKD